ncbi:MAG: ABC transporter permease, partial [Solirubrobacteraceae bacterium]
FVYMRDIEPIWEVSSQILFYASPIIIPVVAVQQRVSPTLLHAYMLNPLADIIQQFRHAFITPATPSVSALLGSDVAVLIPVGIILAIFALGLWVFNRVAPRVAEDL